MTAQEIFEAVASSPLRWPWKSTCLERNTLQAYRQRSLSVNISVAEFYHENSKLFPEMLSELAASWTSVANFRNEFLKRRADAVKRTASLETKFSPEFRQMLTNVGQHLSQQLFYAVELRLLINKHIASFEPLSDTIQVFREISTEELRTVKRALKLLEPSSERNPDHPLLFVVVFFARNDIFFGARGYRRSLLEAGQVIEGVIRIGAGLGYDFTALYEFADRDLDGVLSADGTEEGTVAALVLRGA
jgi:hypothetical protein